MKTPENKIIILNFYKINLIFISFSFFSFIFKNIFKNCGLFLIVFTSLAQKLIRNYIISKSSQFKSKIEWISVNSTCSWFTMRSRRSKKSKDDHAWRQIIPSSNRFSPRDQCEVNALRIGLWRAIGFSESWWTKAAATLSTSCCFHRSTSLLSAGNCCSPRQASRLVVPIGPCIPSSCDVILVLRSTMGKYDNKPSEDLSETFQSFTLFLIFRRIFFNDFSSAFVNGSLCGIG